MTRFYLGAVALLTLTFATMPQPAKAQGFHFSSRGFHMDVGNPHGYFGHYGNYRRHVRPPQHCDVGNPYGHGYGHGRRHVWHDTSHFDWHPTEYRRHGNHWDVFPGHYDWHQTGHVDHLHP